MTKEHFVQFYSLVGNNPNLMGLPFNIIDHTDNLIVTLYNYISDRTSTPTQESIDVMSQLQHRGKSLTANFQNVKDIYKRESDHLRIEHMLTRVIDETSQDPYQVLISVIHNRVNDGTMAYRASPLRLFLGKDKKSWVKLEPLVEPLTGEASDGELLAIVNLNVAVSQRPPPTKSYRHNLISAQSSA